MRAIPQPLAIAGLAIFSVVALFIWQGHAGFSLWDEGFLWYGAQRTTLGEVPIRDFMAYDPGRYYWSALWMTLLRDDGIVTLRLAIAAFQVLGLAAGLWLVAASFPKGQRPAFGFLLLSALILIVWMYPRHKVFDAALALLLIATLAWLIRSPVPRRYLIAGVGLGLIATFGRNHGVYGALGSLGVLLWLRLPPRAGLPLVPALGLGVAGVALGYLPVLAMIALVPGFQAAFLDSIRFLFDNGATNVPLPIPWPWTVDLAGLTHFQSVRAIVIGIFFLALPVFAGLGILWAVAGKLRGNALPAPFVAAAFLGLPYLHFALSRAGIGHLAQAIFPLLIGLLALMAGLAPRQKWPLVGLLMLASLVTVAPVQPGWRCQFKGPCVGVSVAGSELRVEQTSAEEIAFLQKLDATHAPDGESFYAAPFWPGAYALLGKKAPNWEIYALFRRSPEFEAAEIARLQAADLAYAVILDLPLDGNEALRFANTHPLTAAWLSENFRPTGDSSDPAITVYVPKAAP